MNSLCLIIDLVSLFLSFYKIGDPILKFDGSVYKYFIKIWRYDIFLINFQENFLTILSILIFSLIKSDTTPS